MNTKQLTGYPSIDKPWLKYYSEEALNAPLPTMTVYQNIYQNNKAHLNNTAIKYFGFEITYKKLFIETELCAKSLKALGVKKGDCITLCVAGVPEAIYLMLACSKIGAIANFINPMFSVEQMIARINETEANLLFVLDKMYLYINKAIEKTSIKKVVIIPATASLPLPLRVLTSLKSKQNHELVSALKNKTNYLLWNKFISSSKKYSFETEEPYVKNTPAIMVYSSGTTGASKGIVLTNDGINATIFHYLSNDFLYKRGDSFLQMIPVWFSTGSVLSVLMPLCLGLTVIPEPMFCKENFVKDIIKYKPNMTLAATSLWIYAINSIKFSKVDLSFLTHPITGGEQLLPQAEKEINHFLKVHGSQANILVGWGMCELGSTITATSPNHSKIGSTGFPISNVKVAAFDLDSNEEKKYGERGELRVFSPARMKEYYKNQNATNAFFRKDKNGDFWGCTGDIGYIDEDGDVFVLGRASDCYYTDKGVRVFAFDAEYVILQDDDVSMCKVVYTTVNGQKSPVAHIILKKQLCDGKTVIKRIHSLCINHLEEYAIPQYYKLRSAFPVHSNGKRDIEALKNERDGYLTPNGENV